MATDVEKVRELLCGRYIASSGQTTPTFELVDEVDKEVRCDARASPHGLWVTPNKVDNELLPRVKALV